MTRRILIIRTGETDPAIRDRFGDYDRWFTSSLAAQAAAGLEFAICDATREPIPAHADDAGVIVTGSARAVYRREPWMDLLDRFLRSAGGAGRPVLCVCFGHQALAQALGGRVQLNPEGWEIGAVQVALTQEGLRDPLFEGIPASARVLATHEDRVEHLPAGAVLLAGNTNSPVQAFRIGKRVWGTQFHPEASPGLIDALIRLRAPALIASAGRRGVETSHHVEDLLAGLAHAGELHGRRVLDNFVGLCLRPGSDDPTEPRSERSR